VLNELIKALKEESIQLEVDKAGLHTDIKTMRYKIFVLEKQISGFKLEIDVA
jgi:hypothetical protein